MTVYRAKVLLGLPRSLRLHGAPGLRILDAAWKPLQVAARRSGDDLLATDLNEARARLKRFCHPIRHCDCGRPVSRRAERCQICFNQRRTERKRLKWERARKTWKGKGLLRRYLANEEFRVAMLALKANHWDLFATSKHLGVSRRTLYRIVSDGVRRTNGET